MTLPIEDCSSDAPSLSATFKWLPGNLEWTRPAEPPSPSSPASVQDDIVGQLKEQVGARVQFLEQARSAVEEEFSFVNSRNEVLLRNQSPYIVTVMSLLREISGVPSSERKPQSSGKLETDLSPLRFLQTSGSSEYLQHVLSEADALKLWAEALDTFLLSFEEDLLDLGVPYVAGDGAVSSLVESKQKAAVSLLNSNIRKSADAIVAESSGKQNLKHLPKPAVRVLRGWLSQNFVNPYPTDEQKEELRAQTGLSPRQINNWLTNARIRIWKPVIDALQRQREIDDGNSLPAKKSRK